MVLEHQFPRTGGGAARAHGAHELTHDHLSTWYTDFFTELPNAFWRAAVPPEATAAEVDFLVRTTRLRPGSRVLDVACGSGRHALPLARLGCRVTGVDVSTEAIGFATAVARDEGLALDLRIGDMGGLPRDVRADVAICMGNAFGYLDHAGTQRFLAELARLVAPGGALVLDYAFAAESLLPGISLDEEPMTIGGVEATQVNEYDVAESRWLTSFTFRRGDEVHRGTSVQHVYTSAEVARLVTAAGFAAVEMYGDPDGAPYRLGSHRLLLVARSAPME
jgi:SAM-dependent methyltransferase